MQKLLLLCTIDVSREYERLEDITTLRVESKIYEQHKFEWEIRDSDAMQKISHFSAPFLLLFSKQTYDRSNFYSFIATYCLLNAT